MMQELKEFMDEDYDFSPEWLHYSEMKYFELYIAARDMYEGVFKKIARKGDTDALSDRDRINLTWHSRKLHNAIQKYVGR